MTVGQSAQIKGSGTVDVEYATADAEGQAIYSRGTSIGAAIAFMWAQTDAETTLCPAP